MTRPVGPGMRMKRACGSHDCASAASGGSRGSWCLLRYALIALALAVPAAGVYAAPARSEPANPQPEKLWQAYPLNPTPAQTGGGRTPTTQHPAPAATSQSPATGDRASGGTSWWPLALGLGGAVLVVLIGAVLVATRLQPSFPQPSRARLRAAVAPARGSVEALASAASRGARAVAAGVQHVPTVVAERRPRVPHLSRPTLPHIPVPTATALTEPLLASVRAHVRRPPEREAEVVRPSATPRQERLGEQPEAEILKRKGVTAKADDTAKLKQKSRTATVPHAEERRDIDVLKAKLASSAQPTPKPAPARPRVELRPARAVGSAAPAAEPRQPLPRRQGPRPAPRPAAPVCWIEWWRGYRKSHFDARLRTAQGDEAVLLTSPPFRWSKPTPPPEDVSQVARAHEALLAQLVLAGWVVTGRGRDWYALELGQPPSELVDPIERQKGET
jgi:hypothetical protein